MKNTAEFGFLYKQQNKIRKDTAGGMGIVRSPFAVYLSIKTD